MNLSQNKVIVPSQTMNKIYDIDKYIYTIFYMSVCPLFLPCKGALTTRQSDGEVRR